MFPKQSKNVTFGVSALIPSVGRSNYAQLKGARGCVCSRSRVVSKTSHRLLSYSCAERKALLLSFICDRMSDHGHHHTDHSSCENSNHNHGHNVATGSVDHGHSHEVCFAYLVCLYQLYTFRSISES